MFKPSILMSEAVGADAPQGSAPAATPAAPAQTPAATPAPTEQEPFFMRDRIERERRATLKKLGIKVSKDADAAEAIEQAKQKLDSRKEERKQLKSRVVELEGEVAKSSAAVAALKVYADSALSDLDDKQREAVKRVAGEDPAEILKTISVVKMSGSLVPSAPPAPAPAPATTTPAGTAPAPASTGAEDVKSTYQRLKQTDPLSASQYALMHQRELLGG